MHEGGWDGPVQCSVRGCGAAFSRLLHSYLWREPATAPRQTPLRRANPPPYSPSLPLFSQSNAIPLDIGCGSLSRYSVVSMFVSIPQGLPLLVRTVRRCASFTVSCTRHPIPYEDNTASCLLPWPGRREAFSTRAAWPNATCCNPAQCWTAVLPLLFLVVIFLPPLCSHVRI